MQRPHFGEDFWWFCWLLAEGGLSCQVICLLATLLENLMAFMQQEWLVLCRKCHREDGHVCLWAKQLHFHGSSVAADFVQLQGICTHNSGAHLCQAALFWFPTLPTRRPLLQFPLGPQLWLTLNWACWCRQKTQVSWVWSQLLWAQQAVWLEYSPAYRKGLACPWCEGFALVRHL